MAQTIEEKRAKKREESKRYYASHKEQIMARQKKYRDEHKEKTKEYCHRYYLSHIEKKKALSREWTKNNPEKKRAQQRRWLAQLPDEKKSERQRQNNASRKERYANDPEYREKIKARSRAFSKTERGKEINRNASYRQYRKKINKEISKVEIL